MKRIGIIAIFLFSGSTYSIDSADKEPQHIRAETLSLEKEDLMHNQSDNKMFPDLQNYIENLSNEIHGIDETRIPALTEIVTFIQNKIDADSTAQLTFICTHNSRRSHLAQIWAAAAAHYYGVSAHIKTFSGGTESTAFNKRAVSALERAGFKIENTEGENPHYVVRYSDSGESLECFSKRFENPVNPSQNFAAIMTCSQADEACPLVHGSTARISLPYNDPKVADGTEDEITIYDQRCRQIASEMFYVFSKLKMG